MRRPRLIPADRIMRFRRQFIAPIAKTQSSQTPVFDEGVKNNTRGRVYSPGFIHTHELLGLAGRMLQAIAHDEYHRR